MRSYFLLLLNFLTLYSKQTSSNKTDLKWTSLILSIEFPPGPGGIGTLSYEIAKNLSISGWNVSVSSPQNFSDDSEIDSLQQ